MNAGRWFGRVAAWAVRNARVVLAVCAVLAIAAGVGATRLPADAGVGTLVDSDTATYRATQEVREAFGEEPILVLAKGDLQELILSSNVFRLLRLEGCLSGNVPEGARPIPGPCAELARLDPVESVSGPATFLNEAVVQIDRQLRRLAERVPPERFREFLLSVATRYGITTLPSLDNPEFVATVVFDLSRARGTPKARLSYVFPNSRSAQIAVRLKSDLSESERERATELIEAAVNDTTPRRVCAERGREPAPCFQLDGGSYVISGVPIVVDGVAEDLKNALLILFGVAIVVMAATLYLVFRSRFRLLPLGIALAAAALTFGLLGLVGGSLTMATIAVLPILIGLAVGYAIQFQARFDEEVEAGATGAEAATRAAAAGGPTIATACLATAAGFLALQLSPTPMVRDFGLLLIVGIAIALVLTLTAGFAALTLRERRSPGRTRPPERFLSLAISQPTAVMGVGLALAVVGWGVGTRVETTSDIRDLAPQNLAAVENLNDLQETTGVSGQLEVSVTAPDLTDPATIRWMADFKQRVQRANGFSGENPSCLDAEICPGPEPSGNQALLSFGIRAASLDDRQQLVDQVRTEIGESGAPGGPPPGVDVELAGLPVLAAQSASDLSAGRYRLTLAGLVAVALALLAVYRSARRALLPLVPAVLATGWASLILWASGIPLNPMSAALGALTIAIATEFGIILAARFHEERRGGHDPEQALRRAYDRTGAATLASGATAVAGFAVLIASDVQMLRDFGLVTVVDLAVALLGVMLVLPAVLYRSESR